MGKGGGPTSQHPRKKPSPRKTKQNAQSEKNPRRKGKNQVTKTRRKIP
jgi:hypothetical protein